MSEKTPMTRNEVIGRMGSSVNPDDWSTNVASVLEANDGEYPDFWAEVIIASGLVDRLFESFGVDAMQIEVISRPE